MRKEVNFGKNMKREDIFAEKKNWKGKKRKKNERNKQFYIRKQKEKKTSRDW